MVQIRLRESGGYAGLDREIALDGNLLRVKDHGEVRVEQELEGAEVEQIVGAALKFQQTQPRRYYGHTQRSDAMRASLTIANDSETADIEVIADHQEPAPAEFWSLVNDLRRIAAARISGPQSSA